MKKKKIYLQIAVSLILMMAAVLGSRIDHPVFSKHYETAKTMVLENLTVEDFSSAWARVSAIAADAPAKVVSTITAVNESSKYGIPIDEKSTTRLKQVHAVAGGMVLKSGKNEMYGLYIMIKHENAISIYGNLTGVSVVESERIQRGEIIGSYDSFSEKEFYYELKENL